MNTLTKQCPFCAEIIHQDAMKCKHCGEFLNNQHTSTKNAVSEINVEKKIAPQNFRLAISIGVLSIILSFKGIGKSETASELYSIVAGITDIFVWLIFRKYLHNFSAKDAIKWVDWSIVLEVCSVAIQAMLLLFSNNRLYIS